VRILHPPPPGTAQRGTYRAKLRDAQCQESCPVRLRQLLGHSRDVLQPTAAAHVAARVGRPQNDGSRLGCQLILQLLPEQLAQL